MFAGIVLSLAAGAFIALSMVTQRYALACESYKVPLFFCRVPRPIVWFLGLVIYGAANGLYAAAVLLAPLSLVASLFTLLLVWNLVFARYLLGEKLTPPRLAGSLLIILGATASVLGQPGTFPCDAPVANETMARGCAPVPVDFTVGDVLALLETPLGASYFALLLLGIVGSTLGIYAFERSYGLKQEDEELRELRRDSLAVSILAQGRASVAFSETPAHRRLRHAFQKAVIAQRLSRQGGTFGAALANAMAASKADVAPAPAPSAPEPSAPSSARGTAAALAPPAADSPPAAEPPPSPPPSPPSKTTKTKPLPPPLLNFVMSLVYPASLGLLEGVSHLTMKAVMAMVEGCVAAGSELGHFPSECARSGVLWSFAVLFVTVSLSTVFWLKIVFTRYETTTALPVEYGTVNACSVLSGLLFYRETRFMSGVQIAAALCGLGIVIAGVAITIRSRLPCAPAATATAKVAPSPSRTRVSADDSLYEAHESTPSAPSSPVRSS